MMFINIASRGGIDEFEFKGGDFCCTACSTFSYIARLRCLNCMLRPVSVSQKLFTFSYIQMFAAVLRTC